MVCEFARDGLSDVHAVRALRAGRHRDGVLHAGRGARGGFTDSAALERPDAIWGGLIGAGVPVVQTDLSGRMREWLASEGSGAR